MKTKSIKQTVTFASTPWKSLSFDHGPKKHAAVTGSKVSMSQGEMAGSAF